MDQAQAAQDATSFNYDVCLDFDASFMGKDLLRTTLRSGNFADSGFGAGLNQQQLEVAFQESCGTGIDCGDVVAVNRLFYQFPIGDSLTAVHRWSGSPGRHAGYVAQYFPSDTVLDFFTRSGAPGAYSLNLGAWRRSLVSAQWLEPEYELCGCNR